MQNEKEILKCPKCQNQGIYFRETKEPHYKCKKCGTEFNLINENKEENEYIKQHKRLE